MAVKKMTAKGKTVAKKTAPKMKTWERVKNYGEYTERATISSKGRFVKKLIDNDTGTVFNRYVDTTKNMGWSSPEEMARKRGFKLKKAQPKKK